jgi:hypothetical protein
VVSALGYVVRPRCFGFSMKGGGYIVDPTLAFWTGCERLSVFGFSPTSGTHKDLPIRSGTFM